MPNAHYQRVLEQDRQLWPPARWLTRAISSWWAIGLLSAFVVGYVATALIPIGGRYLWQTRAIDSTQHTMLTAWPLMTAAWTLAAVILCVALRRLPMRWDNLGRFICVLGLATILVTQSFSFHSQTTGVVAVPVAQAQAGGQTDPLSLTYTTRYGDTHHRELVVMFSGIAPIAIPLDALPRWNDATGDQLPTMKLHDNPRLQAMLGYRVRITPVAYIADGTLTIQPDGTQLATPTPRSDRNTTALPYPSKALLAIKIEVDPEEGEVVPTTIWLPFEPEATDSMVPQLFYPVEGLGSAGLSFRPMSKKLPFAVAGSGAGPNDYQKDFIASIQIADSSTEGRLLQPSGYRFLSQSSLTHTYDAIDHNDSIRTYEITWLDFVSGKTDELYGLVAITNRPANLFITAGLITFVLGVALDFLLGYLGPKPKRNPPKPTTPTKTDPPTPKPKADGAAA